MIPGCPSLKKASHECGRRKDDKRVSYAPTFTAHLSAVDVRAEYQRAEMGGCLFCVKRSDIDKI